MHADRGNVTADEGSGSAVAQGSPSVDVKKGEPSPARESAAEYVALSRLKPWPKNPRKNTPAAIKRVRDSIVKFGFGAPIVARLADGEIIGGHTRYAAAKSLRMAEVPVRFMDLSAEDAHILALADNRLNELGEWDDEALLKLLGDLRQQDNDAAAVAGWTDEDIDSLMKDAGDNVLTGDDVKHDGAIVGGYAVAVMCRDEAHQAEIFEQLKSLGLELKVLTL